MGSVNKVTLVGNLGQDPEIKYTPSNKPVCNMSIATTFKPKNGQEQTEWHRVVAWNADAENCHKFLSKGRQVYIEGRLTTRTFTGRDGVERKATDIVAERIVFLGGGERGQQQARLPARPAQPANDTDPEDMWVDDGIPG